MTNEKGQLINIFNTKTKINFGKIPYKTIRLLAIYMVVLLSACIFSIKTRASITSTVNNLEPASKQTLTSADIKPLISRMFSSNMVLQRNVADPLWGWAAPGQKITVSVHTTNNSQDAIFPVVSTKADLQGYWALKIGPLPVGGPYTITIRGQNTKILNNVMVGDVWLFSGQSNMEFGIKKSKNSAKEVTEANHSKLRLFVMPIGMSFTKQSALGEKQLNAIRSNPLQGHWQICSPKVVAKDGTWGGFSAVAYFTARDLQKKLNIPIGVIVAAVGGTGAGRWTPQQEALTVPELNPIINAMDRMLYWNKKSAGNIHLRLRWWRWYHTYDRGTKNYWQNPRLNDTSWPISQQPEGLKKMGYGHFNGVMWYRKTIILSPSWDNKQAVLHLGKIDDNDTTWINGHLVGYSRGWNIQRSYHVPAGVLHAGRNVVTIRLLDTHGAGGFYQDKPNQLSLVIAGAENNSKEIKAVSLAGKWHYHTTVSLRNRPLPPMTKYWSQTLTTLYNAMIAPFDNMAIKGVVWYQGAHNVGQATEYTHILPALIRGWRRQFKNTKLPFVIVQLANFGTAKIFQKNAKWRQLCNAQWYVSQHTPHCSLTCIVDLGSAHKLHPTNKQNVGKRVMLTALKSVYGKNIIASGPTFKSMAIDGSAVKIKFNNTGKGLIAKGGILKGFVVSGSNHHFVPAKAEIDNNTVILKSPSVKHPVAIRYGWADNPIATLYNKDGLPAVPFRTDSPWRK